MEILLFAIAAPFVIGWIIGKLEGNKPDPDPVAGSWRLTKDLADTKRRNAAAARARARNHPSTQPSTRPPSLRKKD